MSRRPFFGYFGSKWRLAPLYPVPRSSSCCPSSTHSSPPSSPKRRPTDKKPKAPPPREDGAFALNLPGFPEGSADKKAEDPGPRSVGSGVFRYHPAAPFSVRFGLPDCCPSLRRGRWSCSHWVGSPTGRSRIASTAASFGCQARVRGWHTALFDGRSERSAGMLPAWTQGLA